MCARIVYEMLDRITHPICHIGCGRVNFILQGGCGADLRRRTPFSVVRRP